MSAFEKYIYEFGSFESKFGSLMNDNSGPIYGAVDYQHSLDMRSNKVITMTDNEIRKEKSLETDESMIFQFVLWESRKKSKELNCRVRIYRPVRKFLFTGISTILTRKSHQLWQ